MNSKVTLAEAIQQRKDIATEIYDLPERHDNKIKFLFDCLRGWDIEILEHYNYLERSGYIN